MSIQTIRQLLVRQPASIALGSGRAVTVAIEFAITIYLMRVLGPEPFGMVAMATGLIVAFAVFKDAGAGASLVSDTHLTDAKVGAASLISFILGGVAMIVGLACTPLVVNFYGEPRLTTIWIIVCLTLWVTAMSSVPHSLIQRQHRFWLMAWIPVIAVTIASAAAFLLLQERQDYWPILIFQVLGGVVGFVALWLLARPKLAWPKKNDLREVFHFGRGVVGFDILNLLNRYADNVIIGFFLGSYALGLYLLAYKVLMLPLQEIGGVIKSLAYPRLSRLAPQWQDVGKGLGHVMRDVAIFATPVCLGIALTAPELISVVFGQAWMGALIPMQVLALLGVLQAPLNQMGLAFMVSRNTGEMARWGMLSTPAIVLSFFTGIPWGIEGVAIAYAATSTALLLPLLLIGARVLNVSPWLMAKGALSGITIGCLGSLPLVGAYLAAKAASLDALIVLLLTIVVGALSEAYMYLHSMRRRRSRPAAW